MTRRVLLAVAAVAAWPRRTDVVPVYNIHLPKAGGTTHNEAVKKMHCYLAGRGNATTEAACHEACQGGANHRCPAACVQDFRGLCKPDGNGHFGNLQSCDDPAIGAAFAGTARVPSKLPPNQRKGVCTTILRDPFARAVSAWFYHGHHPGRDFFGVGWPPKDGFLRRLLDLAVTTWTDKVTGAVMSASFFEFVRTRAYALVYARMLGENGFAYDGKLVPTRASLDRALAVLRVTPFGILEDLPRSYALFAHTFSQSRADCRALLDRLEPLASGGARRHAGAALTPETTLLGNATLRAAFDASNALDNELYAGAVAIWCDEWRAAVGDATSCVGEAFPEKEGAPELCG